MGVGKTTIGRHLAKSLGLHFVDSDHEIEHRTGADIPWIFDIEGEEGFRKREQSVIADLTARDGIVLATGGGVVLREENRLNLMQNGTVVYLCADVQRLLERTMRDRNRPLLQSDDPRKKLDELLAVRDPLYREIADIIIDTGHSSVAASVKMVSSQLDWLSQQ